MTIGSAAGKIILFGEHAVVYGRPALAVPLTDLRARVRVETTGQNGIIIHAKDIGESFLLATAPSDNGLAAITRATLRELAVSPSDGLELWIESDIPLASGLGSGAAVSTAIVRALSEHFHNPLSPEQVSALVFETEKLYHGTPSGIDNTVIALERPIRFEHGAGPRPIQIARPFRLIIAYTGIASPTRVTVGDVRQGWERDPKRYEELFDQVARVVEQSQVALERGANKELGPLMNRNQELLEKLGVSSVAIESLRRLAKQAGAGGSKLSGGGRGGNVIVYPGEGNEDEIEDALIAAGAARVITTSIKSA